MRNALLLAALLSLTTSCGFEDGVCVEPGDPVFFCDRCSRSQKNTCQKSGGTFQSFKDAKAFDPIRDTCAELGFTAAGHSDGYVKPRP